MKIHLKGLGLGNYKNTFAKVGDSISTSESFLMDIGCGNETLADYQSLQTTVDYFRSRQFSTAYGTGLCHTSNSFSAWSPSSNPGWRANYAMDRNWLYIQYQRYCHYPDDIPIACEFKLMRPSIVFIMFGTNDLVNIPITDFYIALDNIVQFSIKKGVIPVLSTIPPRNDNQQYKDRVIKYNATIIKVAQLHHVPLWNYWLALQSPTMIRFGISDDNVHPSVYRGNQSANFSRAGLRYGYNQRNLHAMQILDSIRRIIFENGPPDAP